MRVPALSLLLVALASSLVAAAPDDREPKERVRYKGDPAPRPAPEGWVELAAPTPAKHGTEFISVDPDLGPIRRLRLGAASGRPSITKIRVNFADGTSTIVRVDRRLRRDRPAPIDLKITKPIKQIGRAHV